MPTQHARETRLIVAGVVLAYGVLAFTAPGGVYTSHSYDVVFRIADLLPGSLDPLKVWGVAMIVAGIVGIEAKRPEVAVFVLLGTVVAWTAGLWAAVLIGVAETWGGPLWSTGVAILLYRSTGPRRRRKPHA